MIDFTEILVCLIFTYVGILHLAHVIWTLPPGSKIKLTFTTWVFLLNFVDPFFERRLNFYSHKVVDKPVSMFYSNIVFRAKYPTDCSGIL